jgi:hypothetical protein
MERGVLSLRTVTGGPVWIAFLLGAALLPAARSATLETRSCSLTISNGVVVGMSNHLCGEALVSVGDPGAGLCAVRRLGQGDLRLEQAKRLSVSNSPTGVEWTAEWLQAGNDAAARMRTWFESEPATGDILVQQEGHLTTNGLVGVSWGIASVPDQVEVLVPGCSGQRFGADAPAQRRTFDYPMMWEAPFVLIQGQRGGVIVWADDASYRFKSLVLDHSQRVFRLRFESRSTAPFEDKKDLASSRWRIRAYAGNWQAGAAIYREWAKARYGLLPLDQKGPAWASEIRFVVIMSQDQPALKALASRCNPAQTLLYLPGWRKDGYDRNYPDYTANQALGPFMAEAHRLGFRVMLHVNYFGCDPKNPLYANLKQWQVRDPFSGELQWWEWPADPPIKFAYINPASRAWRETFVKRMVEAVGKYGADAFHLDQTLCIYNDKNGIIDGLNCIEGSLALHREMRAALPEVALSGEGLNEITSQYENFAQRHIWGMDHVHRTWDDRQLAMSHAISSAVLTPYTQIYGYLGMANPNDTVLFNVWRRAYEHWGVLPTYAWPNKEQLDQPSAAVAALLQQARFFQEHQPMPEFDMPWQSTDLFVYRLKGGGEARFRRDQGTTFEVALKGEATKVLERRIEGVAEARLAGSIEGWPAYNAEKIIGLNPDRAYSWSAKPRDLAAPHLAALPAGYVLGQGGVQPGFARFQITRSPAAEAEKTIALWDYTGSVTGGVRLAGGVVRTFGGLEFEDEATSGAAHPDGDGLFIHPPWKGVERVPGGGQNVTFLDYPLRLPDLSNVLFTSGVQLKAGAEGHSDGVTFRAVATCGGEERHCAVHHAKESPGVLELDLSAWRGKTILLHLEADPGPAGAPDYDWGRFVRPRIVVQDDTPPAPLPLALAGFARPQKLLVAEGDVEMTLPAATTVPSDEIQARCRLPNTLIVPITTPAEAALPLNLLQTSFSSHLLFADGVEQASYSYFGGSVGETKCGGQNRPALSLHPPPAGKSLADWWLRLPAISARLVTAVGIRDGAKSKGVGFAIEVNGRKVFDKTVQVDAGWVPVEVSLAEWKGQQVVITFLTDSLKEGQFAWAAWAKPRLEAEQ